MAKRVVKEKPKHVCRECKHSYDWHYTAIHPTQKPTRLLERLLNLVCGSGALVLDCFSGSGSTAIACINTNRGFIGFEIDKEYYDLSKQRIDNAIKEAQERLF